MFGPIMQFCVGDHQVKMAPFTREDMPAFIADGGMQRYTVTRYLGHDICPTLEDEQEWFDHVRKEPGLLWGVHVLTDNSWRLIGNTALRDIPGKYYRGGVSGFLIFQPEWWGKGIASHCHRARTMFAFDQLNLQVIRSAVLTENHGSQKALEKIGYVPVGTERNSHFCDGRWINQINLELINPAPDAWRNWWHGDTPSAAFKAARKRTTDALEWARQHVELL